jgi:hypothetical protein
MPEPPPRPWHPKNSPLLTVPRRTVKNLGDRLLNLETPEHLPEIESGFGE